MEESNLKVLNQVQDPELDEHYDDFDFDEVKSLMFDEYNILDCIGPDFVASNEFYTTYSETIDEIKQTSIKEQRVFCIDIISQISEKFEFNFIKTPQLDNQDDFNSVYNFIEFLHHSFTKYIHILLKDYDYKLIMNNVIDTQFLKNNSETILAKIPEIIKLKDKWTDSLIRSFLMYDNDSIYNVIATHIRENKTIIAAKLIYYTQGEEHESD